VLENGRNFAASNNRKRNVNDNDNDNDNENENSLTTKEQINKITNI